MDYRIVIFWFLVASCVSGLLSALRRIRSMGAGWAVLYFAILVVTLLGWRQRTELIYVAAGMWVVFAIVPGLLSRVYYRRFLEQRYGAAGRLARIISWLHPADGWRQLPQIVRALELAHEGNIAVGSEMLKRFQQTKSVIGLSAVTNLYRITNRWEELLVWESQHTQEIEQQTQLLPVLLRAHGETGDLSGLVELYRGRQQEIGKLTPAATRDLCRLMLFAFAGKRDLTEQLLAGSLAVLPDPVRKFWRATAELGAGAGESARRQFEELLPKADPPMCSAIERRLSRISVRPTSLDASAEMVVQSAALEHGHDETFGGGRSLFSRQAAATQLLIAVNVLMFAAEMLLGGVTNFKTLDALGALYAPAVLSGEWWRLVTSIFLHFGAIHLVMNMLALWLLGTFVEYALGFARFLVVYLIAGIGSMGMVMSFGSGAGPEQMTVGASGSIMGLVGATGALMIRGWLRERALSAKRKLVAVFLIVAMQTVFDAMVPQVSMTAHLSGALIGFATTMVLRDRLKTPKSVPGTATSGASTTILAE